MTRRLKEGEGWRLGWDPDAITYQGLVGTNNWAIELTTGELREFCRLLTQLTDTMNLMSEQLMDEEKIACEAESDLLWMEVEGYPQAYTLRFILNQERRCEGYWSEKVTPEFIQATQLLFNGIE